MDAPMTALDVLDSLEAAAAAGDPKAAAFLAMFSRWYVSQVSSVA